MPAFRAGNFVKAEFPGEQVLAYWPFKRGALGLPHDPPQGQAGDASHEGQA